MYRMYKEYWILKKENIKMILNLSLAGVASRLRVCGPPEPVVVEDRVRANLVRHDHRLERVGHPSAVGC